jgi:hypothetical protein
LSQQRGICVMAKSLVVDTSGFLSADARLMPAPWTESLPSVMHYHTTGYNTH